MTEQCTKYRPLIEDFVDGEVPPGDLPEMQEHLRECEACFDRVEFTRKMQGMLRSALTQEVTPELLRRRITKQMTTTVSPWQRRMSQPWVRPALAAAVFVIILFAAWILVPRAAQPSAWAVAMVNDHTMCWMAETGPPHKVDLSAGLTKMLGAKPPIPRLTHLTQQNLKPCPVKGAVASAHVLVKQGEQQVSMYLMTQPDWKSELSEKPELEAVDHDGHTYQVASWTRGDFITGMVAEGDREDMDRILKDVSYSQAYRKALTELAALY